MTIIQGDVIRHGDNEDPRSDGAITPVRGYLASNHIQVIHGLLPAPTSPLQEWPGRAGLAERAILGMVHGVLEYKAVALAPLGVAMSETVASAIHFAPHHVLAGGLMCTVGVAAIAFTGLASLAHITNAPTPHHAATHHAGHAGKLIGTAFGLALSLFEIGTTIWLGPFSALAWGAGMFATIGGMIGIGVAVHHTKGHRHIRDTDRIRAVAEFASATAIEPGSYAAPATQYGQHPLSMEVVYALSVLGWPGATVDAMPVVVNPNRWTLTASLPDGVAFKTVKAKEAELAATMRLVAGGLTLTQGRGGHQVVFSVSNLAIAELAKPGTHPAVEAPGRLVSVWDPIHFGLDDDGAEVEIVLPNTPGMLIGAGPRMGKSNASAQVLCHAAQAVDCERWLIDGSNRELVIFNRVAHQSCGPDIDSALVFLDYITGEITRRGEMLQEARKTELTRELAVDLELDCIALFIGELPFFTNHVERKKRDLFNLRLRDILSRGGACGVFTIADAQKPQGDVVPTSVRDMFGIRFCLRTENIDQTNTVLGRGMGKQHPAHELNVADKGVGYLRGLPERDIIRVRTHKIDPEERVAIVDAMEGDFVAPPPMVPGPGGGQPADGEPVAQAGWHGTHLRAVPSYPDGTPFENETFSAVWQLLDRMPEGFTYREVATLAPSVGLYGGRGTVQTQLDAWREQGRIVALGERRGKAGPPTTVWQRADRRGYGEASA